MDSILEQFSSGNLNPRTTGFQKGSPYGRQLDRVVAAESKLLEPFDAAQKECYEKFIYEQGVLNELYVTQQYIRAYRLGALMMLDVLAGEEYIMGKAEEKAPPAY